MNWFRPNKEKSSVKFVFNNLVSSEKDVELIQDKNCVPLPVDWLKMSDGSVTLTEKKKDIAALWALQSKALLLESNAKIYISISYCVSLNTCSAGVWNLISETCQLIQCKEVNVLPVWDGSDPIQKSCV